MRPRALSNTPSLDDSMMTGTRANLRVALDDRAGLVAVEARHQDVAEDQVGLVVVDLGQRIEAVLGEQHLVAALLQEDLGAAPDRVAVVDDQHLQSSGVQLAAAFSPDVLLNDCGVPRRGRDACMLVRSAPSRSLPCGRRIRGRSSSSGHRPRRAGGDAMFGVAGGLVVDPPANQTHPGLRFSHSLRAPSLQCNDCSHGPSEKQGCVGTYATLLHVRLEVSEASRTALPRAFRRIP